MYPIIKYEIKKYINRIVEMEVYKSIFALGAVIVVSDRKGYAMFAS